MWRVLRWPSWRRWRRNWRRRRENWTWVKEVSPHTLVGGVWGWVRSSLWATFCFHLPRLLRHVHRGPAGRLHDCRAKRGGPGFCGAQEAPPARGRAAQRRPAAPQPGGADATHSDPIAAANVSWHPQECCSQFPRHPDSSSLLLNRS